MFVYKSQFLSGNTMLRSIFILSAFFGLLTSSYSSERQVTAVWDATGDTLALDSVRFTTVSSVSANEPIEYLNGNTLFNPTATSVKYSIYSYDGRNVTQGHLAPHAQKTLELRNGVFIIHIDGKVIKTYIGERSGYYSPSLATSIDDSVAIAFKTGYKDKAIVIKPDQTDLLFEMERDSSTEISNVSKVVIEYDLGDCEYILDENDDTFEITYDTIVKNVKGKIEYPAYYYAFSNHNVYFIDDIFTDSIVYISADIANSGPPDFRFYIYKNNYTINSIKYFFRESDNPSPSRVNTDILDFKIKALPLSYVDAEAIVYEYSAALSALEYFIDSSSWRMSHLSKNSRLYRIIDEVNIKIRVMFYN